MPHPPEATELLAAVARGDAHAVRSLLRAGASPDARDEARGTSALGLAAFSGFREVCRVLLHHGASWRTRGGGEETAVDEAVRGGHKPLAEYLRARLARERTAEAVAEAEARVARDESVLARKARYLQLAEEKERARRGVRLALQMRRAAEHQRQLEEKEEAMVRKVESKAERTQSTVARREALLAERNKQMSGIVQKTQERHEHERQLERLRGDMGASSRRRAFDRSRSVSGLSIEQVRQEMFAPQRSPESSGLACAEVEVHTRAAEKRFAMLQRAEEREKAAEQRRQARRQAHDDKFSAIASRRARALQSNSAQVLSEHEGFLTKVNLCQERMDMLRRREVEFDTRTRQERLQERMREHELLEEKLRKRLEDLNQQKLEQSMSKAHSVTSLPSWSSVSPSPHSPLSPLRKAARFPLSEAVCDTIASGDLQALRQRLAEAAPDVVQGVDGEGQTALHHAAAKGDAPMVRALVRGGCDVHAVDRKLRTPLHHAVRGGHVAAVEALLLKGAKADAADFELVTPLVLASRINMGRGDEKMFALLEYHNQNRAFHSPGKRFDHSAAKRFDCSPGKLSGHSPGKLSDSSPGTRSESKFSAVEMR
ncbi:hypothetical protein AB1Y20_006346 [Prymnesium parvum]|uniref:Uncharacterized protein n=1 Tax=Prymnesium parvum TaxID=97485 RepID=A0AB34J5N3_PRYPA